MKEKSGTGFEQEKKFVKIMAFQDCSNRTGL